MIIRQSPVTAFIILLLLLAVLGSGCSEGNIPPDLHPTITGEPDTGYAAITDISQRTVALKTPVRRIVCLNTDQASILATIGAGDLVYGVTASTTESPTLMARLPHARSIGKSSSPDIELILSLNPDVVLIPTTSANSPYLADRFGRANITFLNINGFIISEFPAEVRILGNLTGHEGDAERYLRFYDRYRNLITSRLDSVPADERPRVYIESNPDFCTYGNRSGGNDLIRSAYGNNIAGTLENYYPYISQEWLANNNPAIVVKIVSKNYYANTTMDAAFSRLTTRESLSESDAVKNHRVYILNNQLTGHTRGIIAQLYLAKLFYPEKFSDINPDDVLEEFSTGFLAWPDDEIPVYPCIEWTDTSR